tara:strand:- start:2759 stop:3514 length:756 start_codon:yes stop_codon:yes gene_type:complete
MANYTITRNVEPGHTYGCTNFSTIQVAGQVASHAGNAPLDGTVEWRVKADLGYSVLVEDFVVVGATSVASNDINTTRWTNLPGPILGAKIEKASSSLLYITLYIAPMDGFTGPAFTMPNGDLNAIVNIEGCARLAGEPVHVNIDRTLDDRTSIRVRVNPDLSDNIVSNVFSDTRDGFHGTLLPRKVDDDNGERYISSYSVSADKGYRYSLPPTLSFDSKAYRIDRFVTKTENEFDPKKQDVTSVRFDIYKK